MLRKYIYITTLCLLAHLGYADNPLAIAYYKAQQPAIAQQLLEQQLKNCTDNPSSCSPTELAQAYYYLGEIAFDAQQIDKAQSYYQKGWKASNDYPYNKVGEGKILLASDRATAQKMFDEAVKINKKDTKTLIAIASAYNNQKMSKEANSYLEKAQKLNSKDPAIYIYQGDVLFASKKPGEAAGKYEQAIYFDPDCSEAYLKYANVYQNVTPSLAISMLQKVITNHPDFLLAYNALGNVYSQQGQYAKAIDAYKKYMEGNLYASEDLVHYASALFFDKRYQEAGEVIAKGLSIEPDNFLLQRLNMYNAFETKDYDNGLQQATRFFNTPNGKFIWQDYLYQGRLLNATQQYGSSLKNLQKAVELADNHNEIYKDIANVYNSLGNDAKAAETYVKYMALEKDHVSISDYFQLGVYYYTAASTDSSDVSRSNAYLQKADSLFSKVSEQAPNSYLGSLWQARTNSMLDPETEQGLAKPYYETCLKNLESNKDKHPKELAECYRYLGYFYYLKKDLDNSRIYWNKVLEIDPSNKVAQEALQSIQ